MRRQLRRQSCLQLPRFSAAPACKIEHLPVLPCRLDCRACWLSSIPSAARRHWLSLRPSPAASEARCYQRPAPFIPADLFSHGDFGRPPAAGRGKLQVVSLKRPGVRRSRYLPAPHPGKKIQIDKIKLNKPWPEAPSRSRKQVFGGARGRMRTRNPRPFPKFFLSPFAPLAQLCPSLGCFLATSPGFALLGRLACVKTYGLGYSEPIS